MAIQNTDYFLKTGTPGSATTLSAPGYTIGNTTINVGSTSGFPTDTAVIFGIDTVSISTGTQVRNTGSYCVFVGIVTSSTSIGSISLLYGTPQNYTAGATTRVLITVSTQHTNRLVSGILQFANQDGTLKAAPIQTALGLGTGALNGWNPLNATPSAVTANGNRSYSLLFTGQDLTSFLSPGTRLRTTRTVAAPTQSTLLNGSTQYYSKTSPAGMTFTDNFTISAWVKVSAYQSGAILSRYNGTSGWVLQMASTGQLRIDGINAGVTREFTSSQSLPLGKWVHVAATLTMSTGTATMYIDGVLVPSSSTGGAATSLVQAGNLEIGSQNAGTNLFSGKIAQVAVFSAVLSQATILSYISQGLAGTETSLISAYSFNNTINDLNTTNANNLTANGSAVATNADSPFGGQANDTISSTLDYCEITNISFSTNTTVTVRATDVNTIPTSGGVSAVVYSSNAYPYGFPPITNILGQAILNTTFTTTNPSDTQISGLSIPVQVPQGSRRLKLTVDVPDLYNNSTFYANLMIWDGTVGSGTRLGYSRNWSSTASRGIGGKCVAYVSASAGSKTYNAALLAEGGGTAGVSPANGIPITFTVELA